MQGWAQKRTYNRATSTRHTPKIQSIMVIENRRYKVRGRGEGEGGCAVLCSHQGYPGSVHDRQRFSAHSSSSDIVRTAGDAGEGGDTRPASPGAAPAAFALA